MEEKQKLISLILFVGLAACFVIIYYLARGYQIDFRNRQIKGTGILAATSSPQGAMVYIDGEPFSATNTSIGSLKPGNHKVSIQKQGYNAWEKEIKIQKELVTEIEVVLTPLFPELKPLTFTGAQSPLLSPDKQKILFTASADKETSLWLLEITERPFNLSSRPRQLVADTKSRKCSQAKKQWSPDSQSVLLELDKETLLLEVNNKSLTSVSNIQQLKSNWELEQQIELEKRLQDLPTDATEKINKIPSPATWSPDYEAILYQETTEDQNVFKVITLQPKLITGPSVTALPATESFTEQVIYSAPKDKYTNLVWYPDSQHLVILEKDKLESNQGKLSLIEIDGKNKSEFFSGIIRNNWVYPFSNGTKIAILTSFNPESEVLNLYSISL
ncbi:PEGA domain-containing protein, partial [Patescibacteria group bacterium]|nr:PEGA domain-containing protein [Patescibacteria group bacterium]